MEKIKTICVMRDVVRSLAQLEHQLMEACGVTLNEAMVLCCIGQDTVKASFICEHTGLAPSHASKVIRSVEAKGFLLRAPGDTDKRNMLFTLSTEGQNMLEHLRNHPLDVPELLRPLF